MAVDIAEPPRSFADHDEATESDERPHRLLPADRFQGVVVHDRFGQKVGLIEDVAVDEVTGKVAYAILGHRSLLGLGRRFHPVPWSVLHYDPRTGGYVLPLDRRTLEAAPSYEAKAPGRWDDRSYRDTVHRYYREYGTAPYWA